MAEEKIKFNLLDAATGDECDCGPIEMGERVKPIKRSFLSKIFFYLSSAYRTLLRYFKR